MLSNVVGKANTTKLMLIRVSFLKRIPQNTHKTFTNDLKLFMFFFVGWYPTFIYWMVNKKKFTHIKILLSLNSFFLINSE
jgi:hypothetical protein